jgi:trimethylamine--corrinoid protein Co-methyltransferase
MNTEYHYPHTADRDTRANWEAAGGLDMRERARRQARAVLQSHHPEIIAPELDRQLRDRFNILLPRAEMGPSPRAGADHNILLPGGPRT